MKITEPHVNFIAATPNIAEVIESSARVCYKSESLIKEGSAEKLFNKIVKQSHHDSVAEHSMITVQLQTDRGTMAQMTRHRSLSFAVQSTRYCNYTKDKFDGEVSFIRPRGVKVGTVANDIWTNAAWFSEDYYKKMIDAKCPPEQARAVLLSSVATIMTVSGNVRSWRNFFKLRTARNAQADIRELAWLIHDCMIANGVPAYLFEDVMTPKKEGK